MTGQVLRPAMVHPKQQRRPADGAALSQSGFMQWCRWTMVPMERTRAPWPGARVDSQLMAICCRCGRWGCPIPMNCRFRPSPGSVENRFPGFAQFRCPAW